MKINSKTKISDLIKENGEAIEAIASINPHFNKLRNPILRKILASRVTIADASLIGNCSIDVLFDRLKTIGFEVESEVEPMVVSSISSTPHVIAMAVKHGRVVELDVRESIGRSIDPFVLITEKLSTIPEDYVLVVINDFEPVPLIRILEKRGCFTAVEVRDGLVYTYITRYVDGANSNKSKSNNILYCTITELQEAADGYGEELRVIDVSEMEMPLPMVAILEELSGLPDSAALYVRHRKVPVHLLPELQERLYFVRIAEIGEGNVKLLIHK